MKNILDKTLFDTIQNGRLVTIIRRIVDLIEKNNNEINYSLLNNKNFFNNNFSSWTVQKNNFLNTIFNRIHVRTENIRAELTNLLSFLEEYRNLFNKEDEIIIQDYLEKSFQLNMIKNNVYFDDGSIEDNYNYINKYIKVHTKIFRELILFLENLETD
jgi:hypothetical protein